MDLRTGSTVWSSVVPTGLSRGPLTRDERCDVAIVGSGLTGAMTAFHLAQAGADVVILDKRSLSSGSTKATTALIQYELDRPLVDFIPTAGLADAQSIYRATRGALDDLRTLIEENGFDCDLALRPTLYLARHDDDFVHLKHEALARAAIGIEASFIDEARLLERYGIHRPGAVRSAISYELDPRKLTARLLEAAVSFGARIYDRTPLARTDSPLALQTTDGHRVVAENVVCAAGYEALEEWPDIAAQCLLRTTYAASTQPLDAETLWAERALLWELGESYLYARTTADNRVVVGGEDDFTLDPADREAVLPAKARRLMKQLEALTNIRATLDASWAATFVRSNDGLPFIGTRDDVPGVHFNLAFGGNGIVFGLIGAQVIRETIAGRAHPAARLFGFRRRSFKGFGCATGTPAIFQPQS